jgi:hypothetical protein
MRSCEGLSRFGHGTLLLSLAMAREPVILLCIVLPLLLPHYSPSPSTPCLPSSVVESVSDLLRLRPALPLSHSCDAILPVCLKQRDPLCVQ